MENSVDTTGDDDGDVLAFLALIVFLMCVECAKEPEYICEYCDKVYKQEARYRAHVVKCVEKDTPAAAAVVSASDFSELLRQNREMMTLLQQQQLTIQVLVSQLSPAADSAVKMNIE